MSHIPCPEPALLQAFHDGSLDAGQSSTIAEHLRDCGHCRRAIESISTATGVWPSSTDQPACQVESSRSPAAYVPEHLAKTTAAPPHENPHTVSGTIGAAAEDLAIVVARSEGGAAPSSLRPPTAAQRAGAVAVPGYELLGEIGRGGMGVVYRARHVALDREVAIKLVQESDGTESEATARFVAEARITGQLAHPGIPAVHELGRLADGRPFLAMKLVQGRTLAQLLEERPDPQHDFGRYLAIFEQVCQAVGYAHARGVIHRDLKPANIMVGAFGEVQVMDWGLAKRVRAGGASEAGAETRDETQRATDEGMPGHAAGATRAGDVLGTLAYMPPEQAAGDHARVDARSDVFALGSVLCELLTGRPPYVARDLRRLWQMAQRGEVEGALARLEACGGPPALVELTRQCLAYDPAARPADAQALAAIVGRLRAEAEERARSAELERAAALVREAEQRKRRRVWTALGVTLLVGLLCSTSAAVWAVLARRQAVAAQREAEAAREAEARRARAEEQERRRATKAQRLARRRLSEAVAARQQAERAAEAERLAREDEARERSYAQAIANFVKNDFLALASVGGQQRFQGQWLHRDATVRDLLDRAAEKLDARQDLNPRTVAELCWIIGFSYHGVGEFERAVQYLERSAQLYQQVYGTEHPQTFHAQESLAAAYEEVGRHSEAIALLEQTLSVMRANLGPDHPETLWTMRSLAGLYYSVGRLREALALYEQTLKLMRDNLDPEHSYTLTTMNDLANAYRTAGRIAEAIPLYEQTLKVRRAKLGAEHLETLGSMNNLAGAYCSSGRIEEALALYQQVLELLRGTLGPDHPHTLTTMSNLASAYMSAGRLEEALPLLEQTLELARNKFGPQHPSTLLSMNNLAHAYQSAGRLQEALPLYEQALELMRAALGPEHRYTLGGMYNLAVAYQSAARLEEALPLFEEVAVAMERCDFQHESAGPILGNVITVLEHAARLAEAEGWRRKWLAHVGRQSGTDSAAYAAELALLAANLLAQQKYAEAEESLRACLAIREQQAPGHWGIFVARSMLGEALAGQQRLAEAEPLLLAAHQGLVGQAANLPEQVRAQRLRESAQRVARLYRALGNDQAAADWEQVAAGY